MEIRLLVDETDPSDDQRALWDKNWQILMDVIRDEDLPINRHLQHAIRNRDVPPLVFGRNEVANQVFHRWYESVMVEDTTKK
jgi:hypothetical protein